MSKIDIGIIGGSGLYKMSDFKELKHVAINTPFGKPSDRYTIINFKGKTLAFLPRHGTGHKISPSEINYRANIYGFKKLGVTKIISVSAVGSLKENMSPMDVVIPHQFFDRTTKRTCTFFGNGITAHVPFAEPICLDLAKSVYAASKKICKRVHWGGTYINMEGPQFSTKAESLFYRKMGFDIIGMTNLSEAKLAREAEICFCTIALVTDYDCWHPNHENVTIDMIINYLSRNVETAQKILKEAISSVGRDMKCSCGTALRHSIVTNPKLVSRKTRKDLDILIKKYI